MNDNAQQGLLEHLSMLLGPLRAISENETLLRRLAGTVGWDLDQITGLPLGELTNRLNEFGTNFETLTHLLQTPPETFAELGAALDAADRTFQSIRDLSTNRWC